MIHLRLKSDIFYISVFFALFFSIQIHPNSSTDDLAAVPAVRTMDSEFDVHEIADVPDEITADSEPSLRITKKRSASALSRKCLPPNKSAKSNKPKEKRKSPVSFLLSILFKV